MSSIASRRNFLKVGAATGAAGAAVASGVALVPGTPHTAEAASSAAAPETKVVKNVCHQCPARCGIDVYVTDGKVHAI